MPAFAAWSAALTSTGFAGHAGATASLKLTFHPDHSVGANQTDVILKMKRFPLLFSPCCPCYAEISPCYFFREISLETLMESAFVDDFVVFWRQFCDSPLYFALLSRL